MIGGVLAVALALGILVEWLVERFLAPIPQLKGLPLVFISAGIGVLLCWAFKVDILALAGITGVSYAAFVGYIISGVIVGSGSNAIHYFIKQARQ